MGIIIAILTRIECVWKTPGEELPESIFVLSSSVFMIFLNDLKQSTADLHQQTESQLYASQIMEGSLSLNEYKHLLLTHFQFHAALEAELINRNAGSQLPDFESRCKLSALKKDLAEVHLPEPVVEDLFADWTWGQLVGAWYVAEGSTLGGKVIEKHLRKSTALQPIPYFYFYGVYGEETGPKWKAFSQFLLDQSASLGEQIIQGANDAFQLFQKLAQATKDHLQLDS